MKLKKQKVLEVKTLSKLASQICEREGKKSQVKIGDVREILKIIASMILEDQDIITCKKGGVVSVLCLYAKELKDRGVKAPTRNPIKKKRAPRESI